MRGRIAQACLLGSFLLALQSSPALAEKLLAAGIWCNRAKDYGVAGAQEDQLVNSLRWITGFQRLCFSEDGSLSLGDVREVRAGSTTARQIIFSALRSDKTFIIEDHSDSPTVVFGQINQELDYKDRISGKKFQIWRLRIDFADFRGIKASPEVRLSFAVGFVVLHELLHGVGYKDAVSRMEIGELERLVNQARAELGLPLRDQYFGEPLQITTRMATFRLRFRNGIDPVAGGNLLKRRRMQYLFFSHPLGALSEPDLQRSQ